MATNTLWRLRRVMEQTGLSKSAIYEKMGMGEFPLNVKLGPRAVGWIADEVIAWVNDQIDCSRKGRNS